MSVSSNPTNRILNGRPQTFFTPPQKNFLNTRICASDSYRSQYHKRAPNVTVSERTRAMHFPHASRNLPELNSRILASTRKRTLEYLQTNTRVLTNEHSSTRKRTLEYSRVLTIKLASTREYSQSNSPVLAIICVGHNFCECVT